MPNVRTDRCLTGRQPEFMLYLDMGDLAFLSTVGWDLLGRRELLSLECSDDHVSDALAFLLRTGHSGVPEVIGESDGTDRGAGHQSAHMSYAS